MRARSWSTTGRAAQLVVLVVAILLAGCEVSARVNIEVRDDGSGTVGAVVDLDADAVRAVETTGTRIDDAVRLDDLEAAGWEVDWTFGDASMTEGATLRLTKEFVRAEDLGSVVAELSGPIGPLRDVRFERDAGFVRTRHDLAGRADLTALTTGILEDPEVLESLTAERVDARALDAHLTDQLSEALDFEVAVSFPGDDLRVISVAPGDDADLATTSTVIDWRRIALLGAAVVLAGLAVVVLVVGRQNRRRGTAP